MRITVNGQLTLMMLYEMIMEGIPEAKALMQNTDGIETLIPKDSIDKYMKICDEWESITKLNLEHDQYDKLILADVNSYIGVNKLREVEMTKWRNIKKKTHIIYIKLKIISFIMRQLRLRQT
ncbi:MAG: hypothetical protein CM15mV51_1730 [uncultured marine virus]|nr:MAG: hypothetical protein CM15mV51_1730 [uncultured marine virus]